MILFLDDWNKPENKGAVLQTNTTNHTFLRYSRLLKTMGIENHAFPLALHNEALLNIDPWREDLSQDEIIAIVSECRRNPWYYFREVARIPAVAGPENVQFRANRGNIALFWLFFNHVTSMLIQPRQTGKSASTDTLMAYLLDVATNNTTINLLTKDEKLRVANIARLKNILDGLPYYLKLRTRHDTNNTESISVKALGNTYVSNVAQPSEKAAYNIGRGMTVAINHIDEIAFISNIEITLPAMLAASGAARDNAREANAPYGNIFTTTAGYLSSKSGEFAKKIYDDCLRWSEHFYDAKDEDDLRELISKNNRSKKIQILLEFNHRQLGYTDDWLREKIADAMADPVSAQADFLNKWAEGSESSPIPRDILKKIRNSALDEVYSEVTTNGYIIRWYVSEAEVNNDLANRFLVIGLDTSDAVGNDDIAMCIRDASTGEVLAAGIYNETNLIVFAEWVAQLLIRFDNCVLVPERKSSGVALIDYLIQILPLHSIDPFSKIFNWVVNDSDGNSRYRDDVVNTPFKRRDPEVYIKYRNQFGYATSSAGRAARDNLYGLTFNANTKYTGHLCRDKMLIDQLSKLIRKNNRIDHRPGEHDDCVIAWSLPYWFLTQAKNKEFYGINNRLVLSTVTDKLIEEEGGIDAIRHKNYQNKIRMQIEELLDKLRVEDNIYKNVILVNQIKALYDEVDTDIKETFNIEKLVDDIEKTKKRQNFYKY